MEYYLKMSYTPLNAARTQPNRTATSTTTLDVSDYMLFADATSGGFTVNLPTAVGIAGRQYIIKKINTTANDVTIDGNGSETIDGASTQILTGANKPSVNVVSDGANWHII